MAYNDFIGRDEFARLYDMVHQLMTQAPAGNTSVDRGAFEVRSAEGLLVQGSQVVTGTLRVDGTEIVNGTLIVRGTLSIEGGTDVTGAFRVSGPLTVTGTTALNGDTTVNGPFHVRGNTDVTGTLGVTGNAAFHGTTSLAGNVVVVSGGTIRAGNMYIAPDGTINSSGVLYLYGLGGTQVSSSMSVGGELKASALTVTGAKSFGMEHPDKPGIMLRHGSTESPVSGIEYWGEESIGTDGTSTIDLPDYFESLAKPDGRTVFVTGRGFAADWTDIYGGAFTVTGPPGKRFSWLVKAERFGGDFEVESLMPEPMNPERPVEAFGPVPLIP